MAAPTPCRGCFAVVNADGGFNRGKGVVRVRHEQTGLYSVAFNKPVNTCAFQATLGRADSAVQADGIVQMFAVPASSKAIYVKIIDDASRVAADRGFHLSLSCP